MKYAPGVTGAGREFVSGNTRFNIRGFDTSTPQRNGFVGARYVDPVNIQRVEVVKGPASLLYGAIEPGGTVNYVTKKPLERRSVRFSQDVGFYEFYRTQIDVNEPIVKGKLLARVNAMVENGPNPGGPTRDSRWVVAPAVTWLIARNHAITVDYEYYRRVERTPFNMQFGLGYKVLPTLLAFGSYSESFTPANTLLSFNGVPAGPGKPITSDGVEFGFKTDLLDGRVSSTISYFEINQLDRISRFSIPDPVTGTTLSSVIQGTKDKSSGFEIDLTLSPIDGWQVYLSFSQIDARTVGAPPALAQALNKKIENSAEHLFNVWTRYGFARGSLKGLWVGGGANYTGDKKLSIANPDLFYPAVTLWDATVGYDWKVGKAAWSSTLTWKNITDETHLTGLIGRGLPERAWLSFSVKL